MRKKQIVTENTVITENGEPRIVFTESTKNNGFIGIEEARNLVIQSITSYCKKIGME